ncbi:amino acid/polyamine transporter I [Leucosporidium creatinivorum]|uniref:Amino acid/polyamine transporter I n=1 Tax=Leucosporidium creatinivorum TaxID=106004 RepID=A0A1Y2G4B3_9BASI|nr:amino acid/polyamine transporter I [Leucosporidium creatinivorum]
MSDDVLMKRNSKAPKDLMASRVVSALGDNDEAAFPSAPLQEGAAKMKVQFNGWSMAALCFVTMSTYSAWSATIVTGMYSGGPVTLVWGFLIVFVCSLCSASSLAEMVSIWPSAEGQIVWAEKLAPPQVAKGLRYYVGWLVSVGYIFMSASSSFIFSTVIVAFATFLNPSYLGSRWHTTLVCWGVISFALFTNVYGTRLFGLINYTISFIGAAIIVIVIIVMLSMNPHRNSASFVFTEFINATGWENKGIIFILGMVTAAYSIIGYDSVAHMAEEMLDPTRDAPKAMIGAILMSGATAVGFILTVLFTINDIESLASTPTGLPFLAMMYQATRNAAGSVVITLAVTICAPLASGMILASSGRVLMSFAREGGLPFSSFFAKVDRRKQLPLNALFFSAIVQALLALIYIGNTALFNSLLVLTVAALNISYAIPNGLMLFRARRLGLPKAPFSLGRLGIPINAVALSYNIVISFFLFFPNYLPVTALNMNYAAAIFGLVHIIMGLYWFWGGKASVECSARERQQAEGSKSTSMSLDAEAGTSG